MIGYIHIHNKKDSIEINIEGVIGIPEEWQFTSDDDRVATYDRFQAQINAIDEINSKNIVVNIRSTGGNVNDAILIYEKLKALKGSIETNCYGYVASAATIIAQAASKGKRFISSNSLYLIHRAMTSVEGNGDDLDAIKQLLEKTDDTIAGIYAANSDKDKAVYSTLMAENGGNGIWLSPDEVIEYGLADAVKESSKIVNYTDSDIAMLAKVPLIKNKKIENSMKIKNIWTNICNFLGIKDEDVIMTDDHAEKLNAEMARKDGIITTNEATITAKDVEISNLKKETENDKKAIETLNAKVAELEGEIALKNIKPTTVDPVEDPLDGKLSGNRAAYAEDSKHIKRQ